jgi:hypothetical protein
MVQKRKKSLDGPRENMVKKEGEIDDRLQREENSPLQDVRPAS